MKLLVSVTLVAGLYIASLLAPRDVLLPSAAGVAVAFPLIALFVVGTPSGTSSLKDLRTAKALAILLVLGLSVVELLVRQDEYRKRLSQVLICMITSNAALLLRKRSKASSLLTREDASESAQQGQSSSASDTSKASATVRNEPMTVATKIDGLGPSAPESIVKGSAAPNGSESKPRAAVGAKDAVTSPLEGFGDTMALIPLRHVSGKEVVDHGNGQGEPLNEEQLSMCRTLHKTILDKYLAEFRAANCEFPMLEFVDVDTCRRFLVARGWSFSKAQAQLEQTIANRMEQKPWTWVFKDSPISRKHPAAVNMRIVGFDISNRPVIYTSFLHAYDRFHPEGSAQHLEMVCEEARRIINRMFRTGVTNSADQVQWIWAIDFIGFSIRDTNPKITYYAAKMMTNFPEMLNQVILLEAPNLFSTVFNMVNPILDDRVRNKINFVSIKNLKSKLEGRIGPELADWICREGESIRAHKSSKGKREYWTVQEDGHDPRGLASYVNSPYYVQTPGDAWKQQRATGEEAADG